MKPNVQPVPDHEPTPVEQYWTAVWYIVEWADGRQWEVEQRPLPLIESAAA